MAQPWQNWSGLTEVTPTRRLTPREVPDVVEAVRRARERGGTVKMPGSGHSFTAIAAPEDTVLHPTLLSGLLGVDPEKGTVTVAAGTPLHVLNAELERLGLSLHNMGDIDRQTIAGAISTGTHGTGGVVASLAAQVSGLQLVDGTGEIVEATRDHNPDVLAVARVGLGALGIITAVTLDVEPLFTLEAHEYPLTWDELLATFDQRAAEHHHFEAYWFPHTEHVLAKADDRTLDAAEPLGRLRAWFEDDFLANTVLGMVTGVAARRPHLAPRVNDLLGRVVGERRFSDVPHRVFTSPRHVVFREMEYALPRASGLAALRDVRAWLEFSGQQIGFPIEIRHAPADDIALSPASGRDTLYLAFHVHRDADHRTYFEGVEKILRTYDGRPHWGKLHTRTHADLAPSYPLWEDFRAVRDRLDPDRVFTNGYLRQVLGD